MGEELCRSLARLLTEGSNPETADLDSLGALDILKRISAQDEQVTAAVRDTLPEIAIAAQSAAASFRSGGRLIYAGAGTSGRLGVLDAAECPPTFGSAPDQVIGLIAGGPPTLIRSREGVEDDSAAGAAALSELDADGNDTVVGISASHRTPWTVGVVEEAVRRGCRTAFITSNADVAVPGETVIRLLVGPEAVTGSTRMKAGTAQKMTLNMISTAAMVLIGKVYGNLMVDLDPLSEKLIERSRSLVMQVTGLDYAAAAALLEQAGGKVKTALLMNLRGLDRAAAERHLAAAEGHLRRALEQSAQPRD